LPLKSENPTYSNSPLATHYKHKNNNHVHQHLPFGGATLPNAFLNLSPSAPPLWRSHFTKCLFKSIRQIPQRPFLHIIVDARRQVFLSQLSYSLPLIQSKRQHFACQHHHHSPPSAQSYYFIFHFIHLEPMAAPS